MIASRKSDIRPLIPNLAFEEDRKKNIIDFNSKYLSEGANALREKLKTRQSRADSINKHFGALTSNNENYIFSKEKNETENKMNSKTANNFNKYILNSNANNNFENLNLLKYEEKQLEDESIKVGLDVEFDESYSDSGITEILNSDKDQHLKEDEIKRLIKQILKKQ